jgi:phosphoribosylformylglycinamidine synthase
MKKIKYNIITFPGSNCDNDAKYISSLFNAESEIIWHKDNNLTNPDVVILPGGFSFGDYLRCGAIAKFSPIMKAVYDFEKSGGLIIGICNGFQILTEAGLLPGKLLTNDHLEFRCDHQFLKVENVNTPFTINYKKNSVINIPIAHKDGNYYISEEGLKDLEQNNQIVFRYCDINGSITVAANPNGSLANIAGIVNKKGNVLGLMPHPERAADVIQLSKDGADIFKSIQRWVSDKI